MEGITRKQIEQTINATESEDFHKYFPSLLVRKLNNYIRRNFLIGHKKSAPQGAFRLRAQD